MLVALRTIYMFANIQSHFAVWGSTRTHTHTPCLSCWSHGTSPRTSLLVYPVHRAPFIFSELLKYWHVCSRIKFQLASADARCCCVCCECVDVWSGSCSRYLICVFLPRVDKDRSGVISDSELQQALSNGSYHFFKISATPNLVSFWPLCSHSISSSLILIPPLCFPIFITPPLSFPSLVATHHFSLPLFDLRNCQA